MMNYERLIVNESSRLATILRRLFFMFDTVTFGPL